jgi:hypothetical protein
MIESKFSRNVHLALYYTALSLCRRGARRGRDLIPWGTAAGA